MEVPSDKNYDGKLSERAHIWAQLELICKWTHWGSVMHICVDKPTIGLDNGLLPGRCQAIIWTHIVNWTLRNKLQWNFIWNSKHFHSRKCISKWRLGNGVYFVLASMSEMCLGYCRPSAMELTHWGLKEMAAFLQIYSSTFLDKKYMCTCILIHISMKFVP